MLLGTMTVGGCFGSGYFLSEGVVLDLVKPPQSVKLIVLSTNHYYLLSANHYYYSSSGVADGMINTNGTFPYRLDSVLFRFMDVKSFCCLLTATNQWSELPWCSLKCTVAISFPKGSGEEAYALHGGWGWCGIVRYGVSRRASILNPYVDRL